jgi:hypothetical protein
MPCSQASLNALTAEIQPANRRSYFFGIYIRMYHDEHPPPHFHVECQGHEAFVAIEDGRILSGRLPTRAAKLVREWAAEHQAERWRIGGAPLPWSR